MPAHNVFGLAIREEGTLSNRVIYCSGGQKRCLLHGNIVPPAVLGILEREMA